MDQEIGFRLKNSAQYKRNGPIYGPAGPNLSAPVRVRSFDRGFFEPDKLRIGRPTDRPIYVWVSSWID